ncbi:MAG TPA: SDR family NAD(P)-dependent oxidoreductase [Pseudonocardiaceae bacterium]
MSRTALVTGANRGLGEAIAAALRARDWQVVSSSRDGSVGVALDVTDAESISRAHKDIGPVDALVNNAGVLLDGGSDPLSTSLDAVRATFEVNVLGTWRVCQEFLPEMVRRGWGRVVIMSSGTGSFTNGLFLGTPGYSVSKTALNGLTTMLAAQVAGSGVLVNAINPGPTRTRMMPKAAQSAAEAAEHVADAVDLPADGPSGVFLRNGAVAGW